MVRFSVSGSIDLSALVAPKTGMGRPIERNIVSQAPAGPGTQKSARIQRIKRFLAKRTGRFAEKKENRGLGRRIERFQAPAFYEKLGTRKDATLTGVEKECRDKEFMKQLAA